MFSTIKKTGLAASLAVAVVAMGSGLLEGWPGFRKFSPKIKLID